MFRLSCRLLSLGTVLFLFTGCMALRSQKQQYANAEELMRKADYSTAINQLKAARQKKAYAYKDRVVYYLDMGMLYHWKGEYQESNFYLEKAERAIEENMATSLSRSAEALLLNDNLLEYSGEEYENVYLNIFKALNYLKLGKPDEALVEIRRIDLKAHQFERKYQKLADRLNEAEESNEAFFAGKSRFQDAALGRYLGLVLYRNEGSWDDARIDLRKMNRLWRIQSALYPFPLPTLPRPLAHLSPPKVRLEVLAFTGLAPEKEAVTYYIHTEEDQLIMASSAEDYLGNQVPTSFSRSYWEGMPAGYHFKIQLPKMVITPSHIDHIELEIPGHSPLRLQRLESLELIALETFKIKKPILFLRTTLRAVAKGLAAEQAKRDMMKNMDETLAFFGRLITDLFVDSTENADLRMARFFPATASVGEYLLEEGTYDLQIKYYDRQGRLLYTDTRPAIQIKRGSPNLIESAYLN